MKFLNILKLNIILVLKKTILIASALFSALAVILSFVTWDDIGIKKICDKCLILIVMLISALVIAILYYTIFRRKNVIWEKGKGKIVVRYGDLMKIGFGKKNDERIVVIPVNTCFDTIVDTNIARQEKPLVSPSSIHGKWLKKMGMSAADIDSKIKDSIRVRDIKAVCEIPLGEKKRGNRLCYRRGTVVPVEGENNVTFFLLALAEFDSNNNAQCTKDEFISCIKSLISFYNRNGQGIKMFLPLMGTNLSRVDLSHKDALNKIVALFKLYNDQIHGEVNIVVYDKDKDKVSISDK